MKKLLAIFFVIVFLATAGVVFASSENKYGKAVTPPFPQPAEKDLQKVIFIRYAPGKEPKAGKPKPSPTPQPTVCYDFLSGAMPKWNWVEDYNYSNDLSRFSKRATDTWEDSTSGDIFGSGTSGAGDWGVYDYKNSILYGNYSAPNVIAVTAIWFRGKNIYEYDIMFDRDWLPEKVDLASVALHEFGHGAGLDDLYNETCSSEMMYGYYTVPKTTLGPGDTLGIQTLYGI